MLPSIDKSKLSFKGKLENVLGIHLKTQKQLRVGNGTKIELFANGSFMCPLKAIKNYQKDCSLNKSPNLPFFRSESGDCYTGNEFNRQANYLTFNIFSLIKLLGIL